MNKMIGPLVLGFFTLSYGMDKGSAEKTLFAQMRSLRRDPREHEVHTVAQEAAEHCIVLFRSHARYLPRQCARLLHFCAQCPEWLRPYVNAYVFMKLMVHKGGCRCQDLARLSKQADPEYLAEITGLPGTRDVVLKRAIQDGNGRLAMYALAMGAKAYNPLCENADSTCETCRRAPDRFLIVNTHELSDFLPQALRALKQEMV